MTLTKKQQVLSVATFFVVLMIIWQVYAMLRSPSKGPSGQAQMPVMSAQPGMGPNTTPGQMNAVQSKKIASEKMPEMSEAGISQSEKEAYLRLASEYQLIQMQRMIAEGYAAIATARLNAAKALAELNKYNVDVGTASVPGMNGEGKGEYELVYLGQQGGEWAATLKKGTQTFDVTTGTVLGKGARVVQIDNDGVVVMRNNKKMLITFTGDVPVTADEQVESSEAEEAVAEATIAKAEKAELKKTAEVAKAVPAPSPAPVAQSSVAKKPDTSAADQKAAQEQARIKLEQEAKAKQAAEAKRLADQKAAEEQARVKMEQEAKAKQAAEAKRLADQKAAEEQARIKLEQEAKAKQAATAKSAASGTTTEAQVPVAIKPIPRVPNIEIALLPKTQADSKKTEVKKAEAVVAEKTAIPSITKSVEMAKPTAVVPAKPVMPSEVEKPAASVPPVADIKKSAPPAQATTITSMATKSKATAAEQAELQALLPPDQVKKLDGNVKPAAMTPPAPAPVPAPIVKQEPAKIVETKSASTVAAVAKPDQTKDALKKEEKAVSLAAAVKQEKEKKSEEAPALAEQSVSTAQPKTTSSSSSYPSSEARLLAANSNGYTIQMIANTEPSSLFKFIKTYQLGDKAMWYRTTLKGGPWCVLIYGEYPDMASAQKALAALPANTRAWTPFVRKIASVQAAIKQGPAKDAVPESQPTPAVQTSAVVEKPEPTVAPKAATVIEKTEPVVAPKKEEVSEKPIQITKASEKTKEPVVTTYPSGEKRLLAAKPNTYTIQLTGNANLDAVFQFIKDNQLDKRAMWYRTTRDGKDWYVLVYGEFVDMTEARKAFAELPSAIQSSTPFIRQMSSIQAAMKR